MSANIYRPAYSVNTVPFLCSVYTSTHNEQMLKERLQRAMDAATARDGEQMTSYKLAKLSGVSQPTIDRILSGEIQNSKHQTIQKLANGLGIASLSEAESGFFVRDNRIGYLPVQQRVSLVPLLSWVQAGHFCESDPMEPENIEEFAYCPVQSGDRTFALKVKGPSMQNPTGSPSFYEGMIICIDPDLPAKHGDYVIARVGTKTTFKKYLEDEEGSYLFALNPDWPDRIIRLDEPCQVCGVMVFAGFTP